MESYRFEPKNTPYHECGMDGEPYDIVSKFVEGGLFVRFRRRLKRYMMISDKNPHTTAYAPSIHRIRQEEKSHLVLHYNMIHPLSMFNLHFELAVAVILLINFLTAPVVIVIAGRRLKILLLTPVHVTQLLLIVVTFFTGYYDRSQNSISMDWRVAGKRYVLSYFVIDLLGFPAAIVRLAGITADEDVFQMYLAPIMMILRYARYIWVLQVLKRNRKYCGFSTFTFNFFKMMTNLLVGLELAIYILFRIMTQVKEYHMKDFLQHAEATLKMIFMVSYGQSVSRELSIIFIFFGFGFHLMVLVQTRDFWFRFFSEENQQTRIYRSVNAYMRYRALPINLRRRIHHYLEFKYQRHFYKESVIRRTTSSSLRKEILLAATKESIQKVDLFSHMPSHLLKQVRSILVSEIFLPGDVIIKAGTPGRCMFFLLYGTVLVSNPDGETICYLRDGTHFGEVALVIKIARVANVAAVSPCELFRLDRKNFTDIVSKYPKLWRRIEKMAIKRIAQQLHQTPASQTAISKVGSSVSTNTLTAIID